MSMSCLVSKKGARLSFIQPRETAVISSVSMADWCPIVSSIRHKIVSNQIKIGVVTQLGHVWDTQTDRQCYTDPVARTGDRVKVKLWYAVLGPRLYGQPEGNGHLWRRNQSAVYLETGDLIQIERIGSREARGYRGASLNNKSAVWEIRSLWRMSLENVCKMKGNTCRHKHLICLKPIDRRDCTFLTLNTVKKPPKNVAGLQRNTSNQWVRSLRFLLKTIC